LARYNLTESVAREGTLTRKKNTILELKFNFFDECADVNIPNIKEEFLFDCAGVINPKLTFLWYQKKGTSVIFDFDIPLLCVSFMTLAFPFRAKMANIQVSLTVIIFPTGPIVLKSC
jgi:hypothetical protein